MISEIVGPGLQRSLFNFLVSTIAHAKLYWGACIYITVCREETLQLQLLAIDESSARIGLVRLFIIARTKINRMVAHPYSASFLIALDIHSSSNSC